MAYYWADDAEQAAKQETADDPKAYWSEDDWYLDFRELLTRSEWKAINMAFPDISGWDGSWLKYRIEVLINNSRLLHAFTQKKRPSPKHLAKRFRVIETHLGRVVNELGQSEWAETFRGLLAKELSTRALPETDPPKRKAHTSTAADLTLYLSVAQVRHAIECIEQLRQAADRIRSEQTKRDKQGESEETEPPKDPRRILFIGLFKLQDQLAARYDMVAPPTIYTDDAKRNRGESILRGTAADFIRGCEGAIRRIDRRLCCTDDAVHEIFKEWQRGIEPAWRWNDPPEQAS